MKDLIRYAQDRGWKVVVYPSFSALEHPQFPGRQIWITDEPEESINHQDLLELAISKLAQIEGISADFLKLKINPKLADFSSFSPEEIQRLIEHLQRTPKTIPWLFWNFDLP